MASNRPKITNDDNSSSAASSPSSSSLQFLVDRVSRNLSNLTSGAGRVYTRVAPYVSVAVDYAWFAGTTAVLLSLPILVEVQKETTILLMQKQREMELAQIQEQTRLQQGGFVEQLKGLGQLVGGGGSNPGGSTGGR